MDLKKISIVRNDHELGENQRPSEKSGTLIEKIADDEKLSLEYESSRQLSQEQQQKPEDQPAAWRKCLNEHLNEVSGAAINENNSSIRSDEMHPTPEPLTLNDSRPVIDVEIRLDTINEDCLREICQYLNLFDIVQLGQTCMHLESFSQRVIFPKKAKLIEIEYSPSNEFTTNFDRIYSTKTLRVLASSIKYLGRFIEDFKYYYQGNVCGNSDIWPNIVHLMQNCKQLKTLTICGVTFHSNQVQELQELIGSLKSLKVLNLFYCEGMISNWTANNKENLTIEKLSIQSYFEMEINNNFLEYFMNLSSLELDVTGKSCSLSRILNHFGHCLKRLKLNGPDGYQSVAPIISANLISLEHLEVTLWRDEDFINLPHLKSVQLSFYTNPIIDAVLRKISDHGMIETLELSAGIFTPEGTNEPPLIFNKLQIIKYGSHADSTLFMAMANAQMPALHTVEISTISSYVVLPELLKFVQSKKTIKTIHLELDILIIPYEFWSQLVDILREPCAPNRELIHLSIFLYPIIEKKAWKLLKENRHLLKVERKRTGK